jgi:hypothetical protein
VRLGAWARCDPRVTHRGSRLRARSMTPGASVGRGRRWALQMGGVAGQGGPVRPLSPCSDATQAAVRSRRTEGIEWQDHTKLPLARRRGTGLSAPSKGSRGDALDNAMCGRSSPAWRRSSWTEPSSPPASGPAWRSSAGSRASATRPACTRRLGYLSSAGSSAGTQSPTNAPPEMRAVTHRPRPP